MGNTKMTDTTDSALRVVLGVKELDELTKVRKENAELRKELYLWKGSTELPIIDHYYIPSNINLIEDHGWDFGDSRFAMRYDGIKEWSLTCPHGITRNGVDYIFTLPYTYEECNNTALGTGFIKIGFETHELHQLVLVDQEDLYLFEHVEEGEIPPH